jgi:hypothetical protein
MRPLLLIFALLAPPFAAAAGPACEGEPAAGEPEARAAYQLLRKDTEAGPFYRHAASLFGKPRCAFKHEGTAQRLSYSFPGGGALDAQVNPSIELSETKLTVPKIAEEDALRLLKSAENAAFGKQGCGIDWSGGKDGTGGEPGTTERAFRGEDCNCQGRLVFRDKIIVGLIFRSAC